MLFVSCERRTVLQSTLLFKRLFFFLVRMTVYELRKNCVAIFGHVFLFLFFVVVVYACLSDQQEHYWLSSSLVRASLYSKCKVLQKWLVLCGWTTIIFGSKKNKKRGNPIFTSSGQERSTRKINDGER
ncbi:MAG: hypothetical protein J3R72DRAFT_230908 [Linnemannia gamsii]|nr:MAG: hypothetical protein J3R72DRAFT_230908 [Linnemannia gamsii]